MRYLVDEFAVASVVIIQAHYKTQSHRSMFTFNRKNNNNTTKKRKENEKKNKTVTHYQEMRLLIVTLSVRSRIAKEC